MKATAKVSVLTMLLFILMATDVKAAVGSDANNDYTGLRKFSRGVANVATGIFEVPKTIKQEGDLNGPVAAYSTGLFTGIKQFLEREIVGIYEIVTCWVPTLDKEPIITPEYLFQNYDEDYRLDIDPNDHSDHKFHAKP